MTEYLQGRIARRNRERKIVDGESGGRYYHNEY